MNLNPPQAKASLKAQLLIELNLLENRSRIYLGDDVRIIIDESKVVVRMIKYLKSKCEGTQNDYSNETIEKTQRK